MTRFPKFPRFLLRNKKNSGIILIVVLWILVILTMLVLGLGRRTHVDLALTKYSVGQLKSKYIAVAGLISSINQIRIDTESQETSQFDDWNKCGIDLADGRTREELFRHVSFGEGSYEIGFLKSLDGEEDGPLQKYYGLGDEEGKINLNGLSVLGGTHRILAELVKLFGDDEHLAEMIAVSAVDWMDGDQQTSDPALGAEDEYYMGLSQAYHCKNRAFDSIEELLLVRGMTKEIFAKIKPYLTVFPKSGEIKINFNTAPKIVLKALFRSRTDDIIVPSQDADSLSDIILNFRRGEDGIEGTTDDPIFFDDVDLGFREKVGEKFLIYMTVAQQNRTKVSNHLTVNIEARDNQSSARVFIKSVIRREDLAVVYWHRD